MTENERIDKVLSGDKGAYAFFVDQYKRYAFTIALKILGNRGDAEEAAQDAFVKAFHHLKGFDRRAKFSTWLYRIVFNTAITYKRRQKPAFEDIEKVVIGHRGHEGGLEKLDKEKYLALGLKKLNEADRTALTLFYLEGFSMDEIATITGIAPNTLKVRMHRARQRLAEELTLMLNQEAYTL